MKGWILFSPITSLLYSNQLHTGLPAVHNTFLKTDRYNIIYIGTCLRVKGCGFNNYTMTTEINWDCFEQTGAWVLLDKIQVS